MKSQQGFSLTELMIVIGVLCALLAVIGPFFADGWTVSHRTLRRIDNNQMIPIIMKTWQKALDDGTPSCWSTDGASFKTASTVIKQDGKHLVIVSDGREKRILLPQDATCLFSIEQDSGMAKCAVMNLNWTAYYHRTRKPNHARFVSCGRVDEN